MRTKTTPGMLITQAMQNFRAREIQIFKQIARVRWQAAAMGIHVTDGDFTGDPRVKHLERGIEDVQL